MCDSPLNEVIVVNHIHSIAKISTPKGMHNFPARGHNQIIFKLLGQSTVTINGTQTDEFPGIVRVMPGNPIEERYTSFVSTDTADVVDIFFDTNDPLCEKTFYIESMNNSEVKQLFTNICNIWKYKSPGYYTKCMSLLYRILTIMQKECSRSYLPSEHFHKIEPAIKYIEAHVFDVEQFDYKHLSDLCNISYSYFRSLFAKKFKMSPQYYVQHLRLLHACDLLATGMYNVTIVSEMCGFQSLSYFSRAFKNKYGVSPSDFTGNT